MLKKVVIFSMLAFSMAGCIKDSLNPCPTDVLSRGAHIEFTYDSQVVTKDHMQDIYLYIFGLDEQTDSYILVDAIPISPDDLYGGYTSVDLPDGTYKVFAWGGSSEDDLGAAGPMENFFNGKTSAGGVLEPGVTTLDDFRMMLADAKLDTDSDGNVFTTLIDGDDLFYATPQDVVLEGNVGQQVGFDFRRNTNMLAVTITGLEFLPETRVAYEMFYTLFASGRNSIFSYDNNAIAGEFDIRYMPYRFSEASFNPTLISDFMTAYIKIPRLDVDQRFLDPVMLHMLNVRGEEVIPPLDIMMEMWRNPNINIVSQDQMNALYEIPIDIIIDPSRKITIKINQWEVKVIDPILTHS